MFNNKVITPLLAIIALFLAGFSLFRFVKGFEDIIFAMEDEALGDDPFDL